MYNCKDYIEYMSGGYINYIEYMYKGYICYIVYIHYMFTIYTSSLFMKDEGRRLCNIFNERYTL